MLYMLHVDDTAINPFSDYSLTETKSATRNVDTELVSGQRSDSSSETSGQRSDSSSETYGQRSDTTTDQIMAFNSADFVDNAKTTFIKGSETDSTSYTKGQQIDSSSFTKGQQTDTQDIDETSGHTITVTGAKENQSKNMQDYVDSWSRYEFYSYIFRKISEELLLV